MINVNYLTPEIERYEDVFTEMIQYLILLFDKDQWETEDAFDVLLYLSRLLQLAYDGSLLAPHYSIILHILSNACMRKNCMLSTHLPHWLLFFKQQKELQNL
jgi:hypothetical protein